VKRPRFHYAALALNAPPHAALVRPTPLRLALLGATALLVVGWLAGSQASAGEAAEKAAAAPSCPEGMLPVPGGTFQMGADDNFVDEIPAHPVKVEAFCLDRTEVTVGAYLRCVKEKRCSPPGTEVTWPELAPSETTAWSNYCNAQIPGRDDHPINCVNWTQAEMYCRAYGHRLLRLPRGRPRRLPPSAPGRARRLA
jgi:formylglycine-generating enzyme required for sulfatase activity